MAEKKDLSVVAYTLGIISIIMAIVSPIGGIIFGVVGIFQSKRQKGDLSEKARKFSIIGIIVGVILLVLSLSITYFGLGNLVNLPT